MLDALDQEPKFLGRLVKNISDYLTWDNVEYCVNNPQFYNIEIIQNNLTIPVPTYHNAWIDKPILDKEFIVRQINQGLAFVIHNYSYFNKNTVQLVKDVSDKFNVFPDIHVYGGLNGAGSFKKHKDFPPNIIIQVEGETPWKIWKDETQPPVIDVVLKPGEGLYIPAGFLHAAEPTQKRLSMSITCWPLLESYQRKTDRNYYKINY
jgi:hypothetical protein